MTGSAPLLHNMSIRPRTIVTWRVEPTGPNVVVFDLDNTGTTWRQVCQRPELQEQLELDWICYGLRGAILVYHVPAAGVSTPAAGPEAPQPPAVLKATDVSLIVNVLGRATSQVLIVEAPLTLNGHFLERRLATDDPRLVRLARRGGASEGGNAYVNV